MLWERPATILLMGVGGLLACWLAPQTGIPLSLLLLAAAFTFLYSLPLFPFSCLQPARKWGILKTLLLASTWTYVTGFLPVYAAGTIRVPIVQWFLLFRFCYMLILCLLFDNRDIAVDLIRGFSSLATHLTAKALRRVIFLLLCVMAFCGCKMLEGAVPVAMLLPIGASILINGIIYFLSLQKRGYFFYYFVVDGSMVLTTGITCLASFISNY